MQCKVTVTCNALKKGEANKAHTLILQDRRPVLQLLSTQSIADRSIKGQQAFASLDYANGTKRPCLAAVHTATALGLCFTFALAPP